MPSVVATIATSWRDAADLSASLATPWRDAVELVGYGAAFTAPPAAAVGGTASPGSRVPAAVIPAADAYAQTHVFGAFDLADGSPIDLADVSISTDDGSLCWTMTASAPAGVFDRLAKPGQPPVWTLTLDGIAWNFLIEGVRRTREHPARRVSVVGRSVTVLAGEPYQAASHWYNAGPATAAQITEQAQAYTGLEIDWRVDDWLVPDRAWSFTGSPLGAVQRVAESIGAVVVSHRTEARVAVVKRYAALPNEWPTLAPDVEISVAAASVEHYERADRTPYTAVFIAGHQQGVAGFVRRNGTPGDVYAPSVSDALLTDVDALRQRGESVLGAAGPQARVTLTLPVLTGPELPGVIELGALCRVLEPGAPTWYGVARAVRVDVGLPRASQTVVLERHTDTEIEGVDDDIVQLRRTAATMTHWARYAADYPGVAALNAGTVPTAVGPATVHGQRGSLDRSELRLENPVLPGARHPSQPYEFFPILDATTQGFLPIDTASPGVFVLEVLIKHSAGAPDLGVGVNAYGLGGPPKSTGGNTTTLDDIATSVIVLHELGITNPFDLPNRQQQYTPVGKKVPRRSSPRLLEGSVVGLVAKVLATPDADGNYFVFDFYLDGVSVARFGSSMDSEPISATFPNRLRPYFFIARTSAAANRAAFLP